MHVTSLGRLVLFVAVILLLAGCGPQVSDAAVSPAVTATPTGSGLGRVIVLGDIDPDEPVKKIERFTPLAQYLAREAADLGIVAAKVVIARDSHHMAQLLRDGEVDFYFDSSFPTLQVQALAETSIVLRRWKNGAPTYWSVLASLSEQGAVSPRDLLGQLIAVEEPHSTSGFLLPIDTLLSMGYSVREVSGPGAGVGPDEIGYYFARDEENIVAQIAAGRAAAGAFSNIDYDEFVATGQPLVRLLSTIPVPRQLVSARPGIESDLAERVTSLLASLHETEVGRELLSSLKSTERFDLMPEKSTLALAELAELIDLVFPVPAQ